MSGTVTERALAAAAASVALRGVKATTLELVARDAGVGRATIYRHFPQGRRQLFDELVVAEVGRFFENLYQQVSELPTIDAVLERGLRVAHDAVSQHFLLQTALREDPTVLEPGLSVAMTSIEAQVADVLRPFLPPSALVDEHSDVLARMSLDYISTPGRWDFNHQNQLRELVATELLGWRDAPGPSFAPATVRPLRRVRDDSVRGRVVDATLVHIAAGHLRTFTVESVGRDAQVPRATLYRAFPGGRDAMISAALDREGARLFAAVADAMVSEESLHDCVLAGLTTLWAQVRRHEALGGLLTSEPELVRRSVRFDAASRTYYVASSFASPLLGRWLDGDTAARLAEWLCRVAVSYWLAPATYLDITNPSSVAVFYGRHLAAGVDRLARTSR